MDKQYVGLEQEINVYSETRLVPPVVSEILESLLPETVYKQLQLDEGIKVGGKKLLHPKKLKRKISGYRQKEKHKTYAGGRSYDLTIDGVWMSDGGFYYGDGSWLREHLLFKNKGQSEFCTPPIEIKRGFASKVTEIAMEQRARAIKYGSADVLNTHYNKTSRFEKGDLIKLVKTIGPAYCLILFSNDSGFWWRGKTGRGDPNEDIRRVELCAPALMDIEQLKAGIAFFTGTMKAIESSERNLPLKIADDLSLEDEGHRNHDRCGYSLKKGQYESFIIREGPKAILNTNKGEMTSLEYFQLYLDFFRKDIEEIATEGEMRTLHELADGKRRFEIEIKPGHEIDEKYITKETGKKPNVLIESFKPEGVAELFADAAKNPVKAIGKIKRRTNRIWWDKIDFSFHEGRNEISKLSVYLDRMEEYLKLENELSEQEFIERIKHFQ